MDLCRRWVPDPYRLVVTDAGEQLAAIHGDRAHRPDRVTLALQGAGQLAGGEVPDPYGPVAAAGDHQPSLGTLQEPGRPARAASRRGLSRYFRLLVDRTRQIAIRHFSKIGSWKNKHQPVWRLAVTPRASLATGRDSGSGTTNARDIATTSDNECKINKWVGDPRNLRHKQSIPLGDP